MLIDQPFTDIPNAKHHSNNFRGPRGQLKHRCELCKEVKDKVLKCTGCNAVRYCSKEHQTQDWYNHKSECSKVKKCRAKLAKEEKMVRNAPPDLLTPANVFETQVGHFWGILETRDYMRARFALADTLRTICTLDSVSEALSHFQDMMRLCRSDNMGVRDIIPTLMLQLDRDQECYGFIKWYQTEGNRSDYDWGDMTLPFLDVEDADVLENVDFMEQRYTSGSLNFVAAITLLKMKLTIDCTNIRLTRRVLAGRLPVELWRLVEANVVRSPISFEFCLKNGKELEVVEKRLTDHIMRLGDTLLDTNEHFLGALLDPDDHLETRPEYYSSGSVEEMMLALQYGFSAWWQREGVLELLSSAKALAIKDAEFELDDFMAEVESRGTCHLTRDDLLEDIGRGKLWAYIDWAVEDSRSFSEEKTSERHMQRMYGSQNHSEGGEGALMGDNTDDTGAIEL